MKVITWLIAGLAGLIPATAALAWEDGDRGTYNNKMALLGVMLEGAQRRAMESGDLETLCLLISIGNDVTLRYVKQNPNDQQIKGRLGDIRKDLSGCLNMLREGSKPTR